MKKSNCLLIFCLIMFFNFYLDAQWSQCDYNTTVSFPNGFVVECPDTDYQLVFSDEFDSPSLDPSRWTTFYQSPQPYDRVKFQEGFDPSTGECLYGYKIEDDNVEISGGTLKISAVKESASYEGIVGEPLFCEGTQTEILSTGDNFNFDFNYTSGAVIGRDEIGFQASNGLKMETRFKLPKGIGLWPAFWSFAGSGEIDFLEIFDTFLKNQFTTSFHTEGYSCSSNVNMDLADGEWHTFVGEVTPYFIKIYVDEQLKLIVHRYERNNKRVGIECGEIVAGGNLKTVPNFDLENLYYAPYFSLAIQPDHGIDGSAPNEAVMEVDYIRVYQKKIQDCNEGFADNYIAMDGEVWSSPNYHVKNITVEAGNTLTIRDCIFNVQQFDGIFLEEGSTLIIDNATITSCRNEWNGISGKEEATVIMRNNSTIENAITAIDGPFILDISNSSFINNHVGINNTFHLNPLNIRIHESDFELNTIGVNVQIRYDETGNCHISNSTFRNVDLQNIESIGLKFLVIWANVIVESCEFHDGTTGIQTRLSTDVNIHNSTFSQSELTDLGVYNSGVESIESSITITDNNRFVENHIGIDLLGTYPLSSAAQIGVRDQNHNVFQRNWFSILAKGNDGSGGLNIINNEFDNTTVSDDYFYGTSAANLYGYNFCRFENNSTNRMQTAFVATSTGDNQNRFNCNQFSESYMQGIAIVGDNEKTKVLENNFDNPIAYRTDVFLRGWETRIHEFQQGDMNADAAGNCFTKNGIDDILTNQTFYGFEYSWFDDSSDLDCEIPNTAGNYNLPPIPNLVASNNCGENGIGTTQIVGPDDDGEFNGVFTAVPNDPIWYDPNDACVKCIQDSIQHWIKELNLSGGDNPLTYIDDSSTNDDKGRSEVILDQWIHLALHNAIAIQDFDEAKSILMPLKKRRWQLRLFGIHILAGEYSEAGSLLQSLPRETLNENYFYETQRINLKRFTSRNQEYIMTEYEDSKLREISLANLPSSGYAISLYRILTGEHLNLDLTELNDSTASTRENAKKSSGYSSDIKIYPNPTQAIINVELEMESYDTKIELLTFEGNSLMSIFSTGKLTTVNIDGFAPGIYFVEINTPNKSTVVKKIIKF